MATKDQMDTIRAMAMNDCARAMATEGVEISYSQADSLGEDELDWLSSRLGLSVTETDEGIVAEVRS